MSPWKAAATSPSMDDVRESYRRAGALLAEARRIVVLTGAGVSTESGIPDFRSPSGVWKRYDPRQLNYERFCTSIVTRRATWELARMSYPLLRGATPGAAHRAIAAIETAGRLDRLVTQNVDGLHQKAGNSPERIIEIHGSSLRAVCIDCGREHDREALQRQLLAGDVVVPDCEGCGGRVKPATISFGQPMPERETLDAFAAATSCDLMLVAGSSLVVYPAAGLPDQAVAVGARLVVVNNEETPKDSIADVVVRGSAGESLAAMVREAGFAA